MKMTVLGRNPECEAGRKFDTTLRDWALLYEITRIVCDELLDSKLFAAMRGREGAGPGDAAVCRLMAQRFARWIERPGFDGLNDVLVLAHVAVRLRKPAWPRSAVKRRPQHGCQLRPMLERWTNFVHHCGGFTIR